MTPQELKIMINDINKWRKWLGNQHKSNDLTFQFEKEFEHYKWWNPYANIYVLRDVWFYYRHFVKYAKSIGAKRIMDHGCAFGVGAWMMALNGFDVTAVEIIPEFVSTGEKLFKEVTFVKAEEGKDLVLDGKFDLVVNCFSQRRVTEETIDFFNNYSDTCAHIVQGEHKIEVPGRYVDSMMYITSPEYDKRSYSMKYYLQRLFQIKMLRLIIRRLT